MGRDASKAQGNIYYRRRIEAAKYNDNLHSREKASELLGISTSSLAEYENGVTKVVPVDKVVLMADLYNAPDLCNSYCINECPIGCRRPLSDETHEIDRITVKILKCLNVGDLEGVKNKLIDIAADGHVSPEEYEDFEEVCEFFKGLARTVSELDILAEKVKTLIKDEKR